MITLIDDIVTEYAEVKSAVEAHVPSVYGGSAVAAAG